MLKLLDFSHQPAFLLPAHTRCSSLSLYLGYPITTCSLASPSFSGSNGHIPFSPNIENLFQAPLSELSLWFIPSPSSPSFLRHACCLPHRILRPPHPAERRRDFDSQHWRSNTGFSVRLQHLQSRLAYCIHLSHAAHCDESQLNKCSDL